jgi:hypothetical protein
VTKVEVPPNSLNLIHTLRHMGYQFKTAIADIIDNSIYAKSSNINIIFNWNSGKCEVLISDDGIGMIEADLIQAMRYSSVNATKRREENDLGRYSMGLKSASLSQARILEVYSKKNNVLSSFSWNINELESANDGVWRLSDCSLSHDFINKYHLKEDGTLIIWKDLDAIFSPGFGESAFLDLIDEVEKHISTIFHKYIEKGITILINGHPVKPNNPFISDDIYYTSPKENIGTHSAPVKISACLYYLKTSERSIFYIYRGDRLITFSGWGGIKIPDKLKLSTVKVAIEITNESDFDWSIDILKSQARMPIVIKNNIYGYLKSLNKFVYVKNNKKTKRLNTDDIWVQSKDDSSSQTINRKSALMEDLIIDMPILSKEKLFFLLQEIEINVPVIIQRIFTSKDDEAHEYNEISEEAMMEIRRIFMRLVKVKGLSIELAKERLLSDGIFTGYESFIGDIAQEIKEGK